MKKKVKQSPLLWLLIIAALTCLILAVMAFLLLNDLPNIDGLKHYQPPQSTLVYDKNQEIIGRFFEERRTVVSLDKVPKHVINAFIAAEDADFFIHQGIDYQGLIRAIIVEIKHIFLGGQRAGGSTITQQTARTMLLSHKQTYIRKLKEMILAWRIEKALSKEVILHLYLNQIYFGNGAYGIEEAAQTYFKKDVSKLSLAEGAALASIPKSPNRINPFNDVKRLKERQDYVLDQMLKHNLINHKEGIKAKEAPLFRDTSEENNKVGEYFLRSVKTELLTKVSDEVIHRGGMKVYTTLDMRMQRLAEHALREGLKDIDKQKGYRGPLLRLNNDLHKHLQKYLATFKKQVLINEHKHKIWDLSKLNQALIEEGEESVIDHIRLLKSPHNKTIGALVISVDHNKVVIDLGAKSLTLANTFWAIKEHKPLSSLLRPFDIILVHLSNDDNNLIAKLEQEPQINGGLVALDVASGDVLALVGGYSFAASPFNRITQAKRQPGSGLKALIYALALEDKIATPVSMIADTPKAFLDPITHEFWRPRNWTNKYLGDITFRHCLRSSINICTISLLEQIGIDRFLQFAEKVELSSKATPYQRNLTIALGSSESYPINVANAMRVLGNSGNYSSYRMIESIKYSDNKVEKTPKSNTTKVLSSASAFIISHILQDVIGAKRSSKLPHTLCQLAGKTGTTNDARSTWFFGYSPSILALVYIGYDDNRSIGADAYGINTAFPTWARFMDGLKEHHEPTRFAVPDDIEWRYVNKETGEIKKDFVIDQDPNIIAEAFIAGSVPDNNINHVAKPQKMVDEEAFAP